MPKAIDPSRRVLYFRKLGEAKEGSRLVLQTEHEKSASRDSDTTATKDGAVTSNAVLEEEVSINALVGKTNPTFTMLEDSVYGTDTEQDGYDLEMWVVNLDAKKSGNKYESEYRQGHLSEFTQTYPSDDNAEVEGTFVTHGRRKKGQATLTPQQIDELSYVFHDLTKKDAVPDPGGNNQSTP